MESGNRLLDALRDGDRKRLLDAGTEVQLAQGTVLYEPGDLVCHAYFPFDAALGGFMVLMEDGRAVEAALVGREGALGGIVSHGNIPAFGRALVLNGGTFLKIRTVDIEAIKVGSRHLVNMFARYSDCLLAQVFQSVACNAAHLLEERAAKWLIASVERTGEEHITITQEQLAGILGVGRSYVSRVIQRFKAAGLIATRRGGFVILDRDGLARESCPCGVLVTAHFDEVLAGVYPEE